MTEGNDTGRGLPESEFAQLMQSVTAMAPLLKGVLGAVPDQSEPPHPQHTEHDAYCRRREALLIALKPYLSPARCQAVDYLIRLSRVGDAIRNLQ